jgi:uncharacterized repeat protein (TIGR03803 family)
VFGVNTNGTDFTSLHTFTFAYPVYGGANSDGVGPEASTLSGNTLYGTAAYGGISGAGTVFSISLPPAPPQLSIKPSGANVILTWPTNATGFTLQSTTSLVSSAWTTVLPPFAVVSGQNTVTNLVAGSRRFYRLAQ